MATTKFKIRGMRRISIPASSATIGCNIAALRVKVIGLAPCSLVRSQIHPVYRTVLRHRIPRSTSFGTKRVAGDADLGQSPRTMAYRRVDGARPAAMPALTRIVEDPDLPRRKKSRHSLRVTGPRQRAGDDDPIIAGEHPRRGARGNAPSAAVSTSPPAPRVSCVYFSLFGSGFAGLGRRAMRMLSSVRTTIARAVLINFLIAGFGGQVSSQSNNEGNPVNEFAISPVSGQ